MLLNLRHQLCLVVFFFFCITNPSLSQITAGKEYTTLSTPQPTAPGKQIEVLEFFWYGCPHCYHLQPALAEWLKTKRTDIVFHHQPAAFQDSWVQLAQTYYAIESIKATDKLHLPLFEAIHKSKTLNPQELVRDPKSLFDWIATKGLDRKKFVDAYNSFSVLSHAKRTIDFTSRYDITGTPTLVIDGRYLTSPSMLPPNPNGASDDYKPFFKVVDQVINMAKKNHGLK